MRSAFGTLNLFFEMSTSAFKSQEQKTSFRQSLHKLSCITVTVLASIKATIGASMTIEIKTSQSSATKQETSDTYHGVIAQLCDRRRVDICKDSIQWIQQRRKKGGAKRPWRGVGYFLTRDVLIRASASLCGRMEPAAMAILLAIPVSFGGSQRRFKKIAPTVRATRHRGQQGNSNASEFQAQLHAAYGDLQIRHVRNR